VLLFAFLIRSYLPSLIVLFCLLLILSSLLHFSLSISFLYSLSLLPDLPFPSPSPLPFALSFLLPIPFTLKVKSGWMMLTVQLGMRSWKNAITGAGGFITVSTAVMWAWSVAQVSQGIFHHINIVTGYGS